MSARFGTGLGLVRRLGGRLGRRPHRPGEKLRNVHDLERLLGLARGRALRLAAQWPPTCGSSLGSALGQGGQLATHLRAPASFTVSRFCWASAENTNSLPIRRAGSPAQVSAGPSAANDTPAVC